MCVANLFSKPQNQDTSIHNKHEMERGYATQLLHTTIQRSRHAHGVGIHSLNHEGFLR